MLASFNAHAGVRPRSQHAAPWRQPIRQTLNRGAINPDGATPPEPYDLVSAITGLEADIVVVQEAFRADSQQDEPGQPKEASALDEAAAKLGFELHEVMFGRAGLAPWPHIHPDGIGHAGLAIMSRFPVRRSTALPVRRVLFDPAPFRQALQLEVDIDGHLLDVVGLHLTSRLPHGPTMQLRHLRPQLPHTARPAVVAGDFNFWGAPVTGLLEGWRRAVRGATWPAARPRHQIDHVLVRPGIEVLAAEVLEDVGSDHLPVRVHLRIP